MTVLPPDANGLLNLRCPAKALSYRFIECIQQPFPNVCRCVFGRDYMEAIICSICIIQSKFQLSITQLAEIIETSHQNANKFCCVWKRKDIFD